MKRQNGSSEEKLKSVLAEVLQEELEQIPKDRELREMHQFSKGFQEEMERLARRWARKEKLRMLYQKSYFRWSAALAAIVLLGAAGWKMGIPQMLHPSMEMGGMEESASNADAGTGAASGESNLDSNPEDFDGAAKGENQENGEQGENESEQDELGEAELEQNESIWEEGTDTDGKDNQEITGIPKAYAACGGSKLLLTAAGFEKSVREDGVWYTTAADSVSPWMAEYGEAQILQCKRPDGNEEEKETTLQFAFSMPSVSVQALRYWSWGSYQKEDAGERYKELTVSANGDSKKNSVIKIPEETGFYELVVSWEEDESKGSASYYFKVEWEE